MSKNPPWSISGDPPQAVIKDTVQMTMVLRVLPFAHPVLRGPPRGGGACPGTQGTSTACVHINESVRTGTSVYMKRYVCICVSMSVSICVCVHGLEYLNVFVGVSPCVSMGLST